jgi:hypothetical protein
LLEFFHKTSPPKTFDKAFTKGNFTIIYHFPAVLLSTLRLGTMQCK